MIPMVSKIVTDIVGYFIPPQSKSARGITVEGTTPDENHVDLDVIPRLGVFNWDIVLGRENFPRSVKDAHRLVERATGALREGISSLASIQSYACTFDNIVMAYHDLMTDFDAVEHLIRSDRLLSDEVEGKAELLAACRLVKEAAFSDADLINVFVEYVKGINRRQVLSSLQKTVLRDIIFSINEANVPKEVAASVERCKKTVNGWLTGDPYLYLQGSCDTKVLPEGKKALSLFTVNLSLMPGTNSVIYGGVLPWPLRLEAIAEKLKALNADLICLQEVYDVRALAELHKHLASVYAHFYGNVPSALCGFTHESLFASSGLALISKFEIHNLTFTPFTTTHEETPSPFDRRKLFGFDRNCGVFHGTLMNEGERLAHIAVTHESPFSASLRERETQEIIELFTKEAKEHPDTPLILAGDLNIEQGDPNDTSEWFLKMHFVDHYDHADGPTWDDFGNYWCQKWHGSNREKFLKPKPIPRTIDRILSWDTWARAHPHKMTVKRISMHGEKPELALTAHHGLFASFTY